MTTPSWQQEAELTEARARLHDAHDQMHALLQRFCPGPHLTVQHRDAKPPWCNMCGRTSWGDKIGRPPLTPKVG